MKIHVTDSYTVKAIDREAEKSGSRLREAVGIRKSSNMNGDEGS